MAKRKPSPSVEFVDIEESSVQKVEERHQVKQDSLFLSDPALIILTIK